MNTIKKYAGILWMVIGPVMVAFMFWQAFEKISIAAEGIAKTNTILQWSIILLIFTPICAGLSLFGWFAWKNEFKKSQETFE